MNHQPYGLAGSLSAKIKGFMGLPRSLNVVMRKVKGCYQVGIMLDGYNKVSSDQIRKNVRRCKTFRFSKPKRRRRRMWISCFRGA